VADGDGGLTLREAADRLGITERTLRSRIKEGRTRARKVIGPTGQAFYRVYLGDPVPDPMPEPDLDPASDPDPNRTGDLDGHLADNAHEVGGRGSDTVIAPEGLDSLVALVRDQQQTILELAGRLGFYQSEVQHLQGENAHLRERIALLEAPKPDVRDPADQAKTETPNHSAPEQNGPVRSAEGPPRRPWWRFWERIAASET
jgi:hypothetical protein